MTVTRTQLDEAKAEASLAIYEIISETVKEIHDNDYSLSDQAGRLKDLAFAYRLTSGGPQPGSVDIPKK